MPRGHPPGQYSDNRGFRGFGGFRGLRGFGGLRGFRVGFKDIGPLEFKDLGS